MADVSDAQLASFVNKLGGALASGNTAAAQEAIREFNLIYANSVAQLYGQNYGPGNPAPIGASTLAMGQAGGSLGYIPGFSGIGNVGQTQSELSTQAGTAQAAAGLTGFYANPAQSQWSPGTFVRLDPSSYDTSQYGPVQISYVLPSGQLQRVSIPQAQAMGWNGNLGQMNTISAQQAIGLESAPPSQLPVQTLQGLTGYSNLNTANQNSAIAQSGVTGMYQAPATVQPPGTDAAGGRFSDLDPATQQAYYQSRGGDWNAAMQAWVNDSNNAMRQASLAAGGGGQLPGGPGAPQQTMARELQTYNEQMGAIETAAGLQANPFRQQQVIGQLGKVLGGQPVAGFQAPNTVQGVGTAGGTGPNTGMAYMSQLIDDIRNPGANQASMQSVLDGIPTPNKLNSADFLRSAPSTQQMVLQGMQEKYGLDPADSMAQIKNTLPQFSSPTTFGKITG
jgi:hypothetical protein